MKEVQATAPRDPLSGSFPHRYSAFGLSIASAIECPGFLGGGGTPEVFIRPGPVPTFLGQPWGDGQYFQVEGDRFLLRIPDETRFLIQGGREITVDAPAGADPDFWRVFLFGSAFGALMHQRGLLPLHGSALLGARGAFVLTGQTGIGKSTLAAYLRARGLVVLSDDVCAVSFGDEAAPELHPAYPRLHLCPDVIEHVQAPAASLTPSRKIIEKLGLDVESTFARRSAPLRSIFLLESADVAQPCAEELAGMQKVMAIVANTYRPSFIQPLGRMESHFRQASAVARAARVHRVRRPDDISSLPPLADLIQRLEAQSLTPEEARS